MINTLNFYGIMIMRFIQYLLEGNQYTTEAEDALRKFSNFTDGIVKAAAADANNPENPVNLKKLSERVSKYENETIYDDNLTDAETEVFIYLSGALNNLITKGELITQGMKRYSTLEDFKEGKASRQNIEQFVLDSMDTAAYERAHDL